MLTRRPNPATRGDSTRHGSFSSASAVSTAKPTPATRFSFDQLFRRMRTKSSDLGMDVDKEAGSSDGRSRERADSRGGDVRRKLHKTAATIKSTLRPPPLTIATSSGSTAAPPLTQGIATLCQSPGGRANMSLAIPVSPPSSARKQQPRTQKEPLPLSDDDDALRSSFSLGSWRESSRLVEDHRSSRISSTRAVDLAINTSKQSAQARDPLSAFAFVPRELVPDVRMVCTVASSVSLRLARQYVCQLLRVYVFEVRATKWAAYFLLLIRDARRARVISSADALSVRFAICAYVRREAETRHRLKQAQEKTFQHKMTEYRVAMQCVCGTSVVKYGRKGKPHLTHLMIENGDTFKWTSAKLLSSKKHIAKKSISLGEIIDVRAGPTTEVLVKALQKGTLRLQDAKCTLSLITHKRTFDIKARSTAEREWLYRSFKFLVELAREHEKQVAQQVELSIMKKMETLCVWKHGRKGRPHKTRLMINRYGELSWQGRSGDTILLEEIEAIEVGHTTPVFERSRKTGLTTARATSRCFSLVTQTRTLDIEAVSEQQRDWYVVAIRYLMDKVHEKTAAIKREKAEKQLKMIHELCGSTLDVGDETGNVGISMSQALHA